MKEKEKSIINIFINDEKFKVNQEQMTGSEIKQLGTIPHDNKLFLEKPGSQEDEMIADDRVVQLRSGFHFYDLPVGVVGDQILPLVQEQIETARNGFPNLQHRPAQDGTLHVEVPDFPVPDGWRPRTIPLIVVLPIGFPTSQPGGFDVGTELTLANGTAPTQGVGTRNLNGQQWLHFCWNPKTWQANRETLWRYLKFCYRRLAEVKG